MSTRSYPPCVANNVAFIKDRYQIADSRVFRQEKNVNYNLGSWRNQCSFM